MMIRKMLTATAVALLLTGCGGWTATRQLIAEEQRDSIGLSGDYQSSERFLRITLEGNNLYTITMQGIGSDGEPERVTAAFDFIRSDRSGDDQDGYSYDNFYLMEIPRTDDDGNVSYAYEIVRSSYTDQDRNPTFSQFEVICSGATAQIATGGENGCAFTDHAALRAAALDAMAWADEARMRIYEEQFFPRES
ncbi:MAG: hypothetical protein NBV68_08830 [Erythrobacter sp.]|uniref:hypothetical protein n=1 Tax=Erythrobacter sp. TaxID=1042 RepID=UPI0025CE1462|nr:hypothetical protein [Erythrobacter sp.]MCL9999473.1 hypothetical protein [Erythrobacter sp.]